MKQTDVTEQTLIGYLLGKLSEPEQEAVEQECFIDKAQYDQLGEAENSLIDDYVRGYLHGADRALFKQHFLSVPSRRERVKIATALVREIDLRVSPQPAAETQSMAASVSWWQKLMASVRAPKLMLSLATALALIIVAGGFWLFFQSRQLREQIARTESISSEQQRRIEELERTMAAERTQNSQLNAELEQLRREQNAAATSSSSLPRTMLFVLNAGVMRSSESESLSTLRLPKDLGRVTIQMLLADNPVNDAGFSAVLKSAEGKELSRWGKVKAVRVKKGGAALNLALSAKNLSAGDYVMIVNKISARGATDEFRRVPFRVVRR